MNSNTMPLEAETRVLIDRSLENLGWKFQGKDKNVFFEQPRTESEKKRLDGKRPDYVLYSKDSDKPLIVIEAKKKGSCIDAALEQGIGYARVLEAPLVFATDGVFCKAFHTVANRAPILNGEEVDEFIREALALRYLSSYEVNTVSPKVQYDRRELIRIFDEANNMLRGEGLRAGIERFGEFANILFLKLISESEQIKRENGINTNFDNACSWDSIKNIPISTRIEYINKTVYEKLNDLYETDIFTPLQIRDTSILKEIMDKLDPLTITDVDSDVKGDAFEYFLKASTSTKNDLGEYFTPRHIVKTMVRLVNPQIGETIYDPFCGTGGFLIESFRHIYNNMARTDANLKILREKTVYGNEITNTARITKMNMILAGDGHSNIKMKDSLANPIDGKSTYIDEKGEEHHNGYDIVLANMPYSQKTKYGNLYDLPSNNGDSICIQHCIKAVDSASENGRIALVVPEGFLFRKDLTKTREYLLENCQLQSVISLPQGVFLPYTGVKTDIIYATKVNRKISSSEKRKDFWYFDVKSDGYSLDNHRRKLDTPSDLSKYEEYRKLDVDQVENMLKVGFEVIPLDKVYKNSNILVGSRYRTHTVKKSKSHEMVKLGNIATFIRGISFPKKAQKDQADDLLNVITTRAAQADGIDFEKVVYIEKSYTKPDKMVFKGDILISLANSLELVGRVTYVDENYKDATFGAFMGVIRVNYQKVHPMYLFHILNSIVVKKYFRAVAKTTTNISNITFEDLGNLVLPLPRLDDQLKIIDELNRYHEMIVGAKKIMNNYLPKLPSYEIFVSTSLNDSKLFEIMSGGTPSTKNPDYWGGDIFWITLADLPQEEYVTTIDKSVRTITKKGLDNSSAKILPVGAIVVSTRATIGRVGIVKHPLATNQGFKNVIIKKPDVVIPEFLALLLKEKTEEMEFLASGATFKEISKFNFGKIKVELPSLDEQKRILVKIHEEESFVKPAKKVIEVFENKIDTAINKIWGE
ncbi:N-6 DNA methylase [Peptoniphilus vaginalis]|uniref:N-6 DNA methylase n=1 Tax=Peptoniphilus vaginalis TaxID=1756987 RepID=UPI000A26CB62|nr:N-6 DNA methylase [Peptoniphilus vaginalis]